ncbi:MAG: glycosyltransferase [Granulosicoccus sp.]
MGVRPRRQSNSPRSAIAASFFRAQIPQYLRYSIIIPAWNEAELLPQSLVAMNKAMQEVTEQSEHAGELIVVDNNSTDDTAVIARRAGAQVVFEPINQIARARNRGVTIASGDALIFVDADSSCSSVLLLESLDLLESGKVAGGGSVIAPDQEIGRKAHQLLKYWNSLSVKAKLAAGCFVFCRRDAFETIGGFNVKVYAGEEIYLSRRLKRWARTNGMSFRIIEKAPVRTSVRKLHWYGPLQLAAQLALVMIPGALYSRRLCRTWYDRTKR